jgi:hypothetical protein
MVVGMNEGPAFGGWQHCRGEILHACCKRHVRWIL